MYYQMFSQRRKQQLNQRQQQFKTQKSTGSIRPSNFSKQINSPKRSSVDHSKRFKEVAPDDTKLKSKDHEDVYDDDDDVEDNDDDSSMETEDDKKMIEEHEDLRENLASSTLDKLRPNEDLYLAIKERYQELLKELWKSQNSLEEFNFSNEEKKILNDRVKLWLEYFVSTATFRDENVNLFDYMDSFTETQKFI